MSLVLLVARIDDDARADLVTAERVNGPVRVFLDTPDLAGDLAPPVIASVLAPSPSR